MACEANEKFDEAIVRAALDGKRCANPRGETAVVPGLPMLPTAMDR